VVDAAFLVLIGKKSAMEGAHESAGLNVHDIVVFMDHVDGVKGQIYKKMVIAHAVLINFLKLQKLCIKQGRINKGSFGFFGLMF